MDSKSFIKYVIAIASLTMPVRLSAQDKESVFRFEYGLDWGVTTNVLYYYHVNYSAAETGARVNTEETKPVCHVNGQMLAYVGTEIGPKWSTELLCGLSALYDGSTSVPMTIRVSFFPNSRDHLKLKLFAEGGSAFAPSFKSQAPLLFKAGAGTRIKLARRVSMDFMAALQMYMCHPTSIWDGVNNTQVYEDMMKKCDSIYAGINISMSLNFR